jgi:predicted dinucleotide-binding enzyme
MRIGIVGSGMIGGTLARLLTAAGHDVVIGNTRGPESLAGLVAELGLRATAATAEGAAEAGDVVIVAIPFAKFGDLPAAVLAGKVVVDTGNYYRPRDGAFPEIDAGTTGSSEVMADVLPGATVVKAFNTIWYVHLTEHATPPGTPGRRAIPIAGDDPAAKLTVTALIDDVGFDAYDAGPLAAGRRLQPGEPVYNVRLTKEELAAALA